MTPELVKDMLELLSDKKKEVKHGTLNLLLQFTTQNDSKKKFAETNLVELLIKNMFVDGLTTGCLSNMINLSS